MKKLLSICFLSVLLTMMSFFTAQAQSSNQCCFWIENMQPETFPHIANLDGTGIAQDTAGGMDLVLNHVLNRAYVGNTDIYTLHFPQGANCGDKVSIEWLLYRDGQLVNGDLSEYADFSIFTKYNKLNIAGECESINWLGGLMEDGDGICGCDGVSGLSCEYCAGGQHNGHNDYPGASFATPLDPPFYDETHTAASYVEQLYSHEFDYFYLRFLASEGSTTQIRIHWKQVGNYSLVMRIRERLGGTDYTFTDDGTQNPESYIGGHQSCCGDILYQDSIAYLVTTASEKSICDDDVPFMYGRGAVTASGSTLYAFYDESLYYVLFGDYECDHWNIERIDTLQLYTRINPDIIAQDTDLCRNENFNADDLLALVEEVDLDAPGIIGHKIWWSENNNAWYDDMSKLTSLNNMTTVAGVYTFYVKQVNYYYDAMDDDTIGCGGDVAIIHVNVRDLFPPILENDHVLYFCNETLEENSPLILTAHLNPLDECSKHIRWYVEDALGLPNHNDDNWQITSDTFQVDLTELNPTNIENNITFYLYAYDDYTGTYSVGYDSVKIVFYQTPIFTVADAQTEFVVCPGAEVTMESNVTSTEPEYNGEMPVLTYQWYKNGELLSVTSEDYVVDASMICGHTDTFMVKITATSYVGCVNTMTRTYTILSQDIVNPVITWNENVGIFDDHFNKIDTLSGCDSSAVPAPFAVNDFMVSAGSTSASTEVGTIIDPCGNIDSLIVTDIALHTTCQTIVTRSYVALDACGNRSNAIVHIFTIVNDYTPVIENVVSIDPVRPLHNDCKENAPSYATMRARFDTAITVAYVCPETTIDTVVFYLENTDVLAPDAEDIFADTDQVTIYAVVTDICGNQSAKSPVFTIHEPEPIYIAHGAITLDTLELCADQTTNMHFNDGYVINGGRPYEYAWSQISVVGQSIITPDSNNYLEAVVSPADQMINTSTHFVMTVTDVYGCVAADTSNAIHFYRLPDVTITDDPRNAGYPHADGDTVCPNYGNFYVIANGHSNLPDSIPGYQNLGYVWSGSAIDLNPYTSTNLFKLACENCDTSYTPIVTVTNKKNCSATATYTIHGYDGTAPVITAITEIEMPLVPGRECEIQVPNFVNNNLYFNPATVSDNCFKVSEMTFTQNVTPGIFVSRDTIVYVTIDAPCGPDAVHPILVKMPSNTVRITGITADPAAGCEPLNTTLTPTIINAVGTIDYDWSTGVHTETADVTATYANHTYTLTVTDDAGCSSSLTFEPTVYRVPVREDFDFVMTPNRYCTPTPGDGTEGIVVLNDSTAHLVGYSMTTDNYLPYRPLDYVYTDLLAGEYYFTLYTSDGCSATFKDTVTTDTTDSNAPFIAEILSHNYKCEPFYSGSVRVYPQIENYVYEIISDTHFTDGEIQTGLADVITPLMFNWLYQDTYRILVTTTHNCHFLTNEVVVLNQTDTPDVHVITMDPVTDCVTPNGVLYIQNTNPTYTYTVAGITKPGNNGTLIYSGLREGDYIIHMVSSGLCVFDQPFHMSSNTPGPAEPNVTTHPDNYCFGAGANGSITVPAADVVQGYTYTIVGEGTYVGTTGNAVIFDGLHGDTTYSLVITDIHHCATEYPYTIAAAPLNVTIAPTEVQGNNGNNCATPNNSIVIAAVPEFTYTVIDEAGDTVDAADYSALEDGTYIVRKMHSTFTCFHDTTLTLAVVPPVYVYEITVTPDEDCSTEGTGSIAIVNPSSNFTYFLINSLGERINTFTNLDAGVYEVHALHNTTMCDYVIDTNVRLNPYYPIVDTVVSTPNLMCVDTKNGTVLITLEAPVPAQALPATYYLQMGSETYHNNTGYFTQLNSGDYSFYIESALHCQSLAGTINVVDSAFIRPEFSVKPNHTCDSTLNQPGTGCITLEYPHDVNGVHGYQMIVLNPGVWRDTIRASHNYEICRLADHDYIITVVDTVTGCTFDTVINVPFIPVNITMDVVVTPNNNCEGTGNGTITVNAVSDNMDSRLEYAILTAASTDTIWHANGSTVISLSTDTYEVIVRDLEFNCIFDTLVNKMNEVELEEKPLTIDYTAVNNTACDPALYNGSITINSVTYADGSDVNYTAAITGDAWTGLNAGNYTITIKDNVTGCDTVFDVALSTDNNCAPTISISSTGYNNHGEYFFCYGDSLGFLHATATSTCDTDFSYNWSSVCAHANSNTADVHVYTDETFCCNYTVVATGLTTGCSNTSTVTVCIDTLPIIRFIATGPNIHLTSANPTENYTNCENYPFTFGIIDPGFDSIIWQNGYVDTNVATFDVAAYELEPGITSYCVWVEDHNGCHAGFTAANVITLPISETTKDTAVCETFHYVSQTGVVYNRSYVAGGENAFTVLDTFPAANSCDSIVTYNVTITPIISITAQPLNDTYCHGDNVSASYTILPSIADAAQHGYRIADAIPADNSSAWMTDQEFNLTDPVTRSMNGKYLYAFAVGGCNIDYAVIQRLFVDSLPTPTISGNPVFCAGALPTEHLSANIVWNNNANTGNFYWVVSDNASMNPNTAITTITADMDGKYIAVVAHNDCGDVVSNSLQLTVYNLVSPTLSLTDIAYCEGEVIPAAYYSVTHDEASGPYTTITYKLGDEVYNGRELTAADSGKFFTAVVTYSCGDVEVSNPIAISVYDTLRFVVSNVVDTICIGSDHTMYVDFYSENSQFSAQTSPTGKISCSYWFQSAHRLVLSLSPRSVGLTNVSLHISSSKGCGSKVLVYPIFVSQLPVISTPADVEVCDQEALTLTDPSYEANGNVHSTGWQISANGSNWTEFTNGSVMHRSQNGYKIRFYVEGACGFTYSQPATVTVHKLAHLSFSILDTVCLADGTSSFYVYKNEGNVITVTSSDESVVRVAVEDAATTYSNVVLTLVGAGNATLTLTSTASGDCGRLTTTLNVHVTDVPEVNNIPSTMVLCEGEHIDFTAPSYELNNGLLYSAGWRYKLASSSNWVNDNSIVTTNVTSIMNNMQVQYYVTNKCGTTYSNTATITVNDTAKLTTTSALEQEVCNVTAITPIALNTNKPLELSQNLLDHGLVLSGNVISGTFTASSEIYPVTYTGTVRTVDELCPNYNKALTISITVKEKPSVTLSLNRDTVCEGQQFDYTSSVDANGGTITTNNFMMKNVSASAYSVWTEGTPAAVANDRALLYRTVTNECGTTNSDVVELRVAGHVAINLTADMFRDTCESQPLSDFIKNIDNTPVVDLTNAGAAVITDTIWYLVEGSNKTEIDLDEPITDPAQITCVIVTKCFEDEATAVSLSFDKPAEITSTISTADFTVCEGTPFTAPAFTVDAHGGTMLDTTWYIDGEELDFTTPYSLAEYNGKEIKLVVTNACGSDEITTTCLIRPLPVPHMLKDTTVCDYNPFNLIVNNPTSTSTYAWYGSDDVTVGSGTNLSITPAYTDSVYTYYVVETDQYGCVSTTQINDSQDYMVEDLITVKVTTKPGFIFTDMDGNETHHIPSSINNETTAYKWKVDDHCWNDADTKVFVKFSIYHNGELIPEAEIGEYIQTSTYTDISTTLAWNNNDVVQYRSGDNTVDRTEASFYSQMVNHYPQANLGLTLYDYDWFYIHFLSSRFVTKTITKFLQTGDYDIHYELYSTDGSEINNYYYNGTEAKKIGGHNFTGETLLATDVFSIHVDDGPAYSENEAPEMPATHVGSDEPTVSVYPNPATENVNVRVEGMNGQTLIRITTLTGKTVAERSINIYNKYSEQNFNVSDLNPGVYVLQIVNDEAITSRKLVITK
ncbi:MAG: T9SS type A sorting domain-containing protein [Bacteroidales bacterium]|nr:T9SS type A sorting domain-containing protein [Bacteroidales bacterium]